MCTVTWLADPAGGYALWFNRDERRTRPPGLPPAAAAAGDMPYLAPIDAEAGGTWLAVNAAGVTVGLLNHYAADAARAAEAARDVEAGPADYVDDVDAEGDALHGIAAARAVSAAPAPTPAPSRGVLVRDLMACPTVAAVVAALDGGRAAAFRPFEVVALDATGDRARLTWDGRVLSRARGAEVAPPVSSSGHDTASVLAARAALYRQVVGPDAPVAAVADDGSAGGDALARLEAYQRSHRPARGAFSVCMHRPDARTVSLTLVTVGPGRVTMRYGDGPACTAVLGAPLTLARRPAPAPAAR